MSIKPQNICKIISAASTITTIVTIIVYMAFVTPENDIWNSAITYYAITNDNRKLSMISSKSKPIP